MLFLLIAFIAPSAYAQTQQTMSAEVGNAGLVTGSVSANLSQGNDLIIQQDANAQSNVVVDPAVPAITANSAEQGTFAAIDNRGAVASNINNTINQENKVFFGPEPTPTPTPTPEPKVNTNDFIGLVITSGRSHARPGEEFIYRVKIRNNLPRDVFATSLKVRIPEFIIPSATNPAATEEDPGSRTITWRDFIISAESEITYAITVQVQEFAPNNFELAAHAELNGDGIAAFASDVTRVLRLEAVGAAQDISPEPAAVAPAPIHVPVTATTGPAPALYLGATLLSAIGALGIRKLLWI